MFQENVSVLWNRPVSSSCYKMGLKCSALFAAAQPGQFIMLRLPGDLLAPLLRRPFSIHGTLISDDSFDGIEVLYKVVGEGTRRLSESRKNDRASILGPLGKGFSVPDTAGRFFFVAGGIGVAPLAFLASSLCRTGVAASGTEVFLGGRTREELLCKDDFCQLGLTVHTTTDDGSEGQTGLVTGALEKRLLKIRPDMIYACGPLPMLKQVARISAACHVPCQISIESHMACGIGACLGCAVEASGPSETYFHVCKDGPVFNAHALKW